MNDNYKQFGPEWEKEMMKFSKAQLVQTLKQHLSAKDKESVSCKLWECDLEENWVKFQVPQNVMNKGFHAGAADINFSGIQ